MQENYIDTIVPLVLTNHFSPEWESWQKKSADARGEKGLRDIMCSDFCIYRNCPREIHVWLFVQVVYLETND